MRIPENLKNAANMFKDSFSFTAQAISEKIAYDASPEAKAIRQQERAERDAESARKDAIKTGQINQQAQTYAVHNYATNMVPLIRMEAYQVVYRAHSRLGAIQPYDVQQIPARYVRKGNCIFTEVYVPRAELTPVQDGTLRLVGDVFQQEMEQDLRAERVTGVYTSSIDGHTPFLFVDDVMVSGSNYIVTIGLASDSAMVRRYWSRRQPRPTPPPVMPYDDTF